MEVTALQCHSCKDIIYSRARHDFRNCSCGNIAIDGGFDYCKISHWGKAEFSWIKIEITVSKKELYEDWNTGKDLYGCIRDK